MMPKREFLLNVSTPVLMKMNSKKAIKINDAKKIIVSFFSYFILKRKIMKII